MSRERYVIIGIIGIAIAVALPLAHGFEWMMVQMAIFNPSLLGDVRATDVAAYGIATVAAVFTLNYATTRQLATEVVDELSKVTWPTREETGNNTVVVIITVLICSAYLGLFDAVWLWVTDWILGVPSS
ncbi:MAG: preprotein translocase subunit SecE [Myxococcota bacterium]